MPASSDTGVELLVDRSPHPALKERQQISLPRPFDSAIPANNFTPSCERFFTQFLSDQNLLDCVPLSLLIRTSNAFYEATKSLVAITQVLDASCAANATFCQGIMDSYSYELINVACASDYEAKNQNAIYAYNGLVSYAPLYYAGCQRDGKTGNYCFVSAITNASDPTASFVYYLPLGLPLPSGSLPVCNGCLENTFAVFSNYAGNQSTPLYKTYPAATQMVDMTCGPNFVKPALTVASTGGAMASASMPGFGVLAAGICLWLFVFT